MMRIMSLLHLLVAALIAVYIGVAVAGRRSPAPASGPAIAPAAPAPNIDVCAVASPYLEKFIEPLTFPPVIDVSDGQHVTLGAYKISQKLHRDLPNTTLYAFGTSQETAVFPGPTLMARRYVPAHVRWENHIPDEHHFLPQTMLAGLSGMYILRPTEEEERMLGLSDGAPLVFKDLRFYYNGSINLPGPGISAPINWCPEWYDVWLVNGNVWPFVRVFAKPYRFRILNACNARFTAVYLSDSTIPFLQIGTDGGFLPEPIPVDDYLLSSSGERADFIIDFSGLNNQTEVLLRNAPIEPNSHFRSYIGPETQVIMKFVVVDEDGLQEGLIENPDYLQKLTAYMQWTTSSWPVKTKVEVMQPLVREITMVPHEEYGLIYQYTIGNATWDDPVDIEPIVGSFEIWEVINLGSLAHNFHVHLIQFQVLDQQAIDTLAYSNNECSTRIAYPENGTCFRGYPQSPASYYRGWKDTFSLWGESVVRILIHFATREGEPFSFDPTLGPGFVVHCHIVQHEDHSMMRPYRLRYADTTTHNIAK